MRKTLSEANDLLAEIGRLQQHKAVLEQDFNARVSEIKSRFEQLTAELDSELALRDKELVGLMKANKKLFFPDGVDKVKLANGVLLYGEEDRVVIPRGALAKIETLGYTDAIRSIKSVDRAVVESWPPEKLEAIGAEKKPVKTYNYEVLTRVPGVGDKLSDKMAQGAGLMAQGAA